MSAPAPLQRDRVLRIVARLIERTNADDLIWERAAIPESWAVDVGQTRFRTHFGPGERPTYFLDVMGLVGETIAPEDPETAALLETLYRAAAANGKRHTPDPLAEVEERLGLNNPDPAFSPPGE